MMTKILLPLLVVLLLISGPAVAVQIDGNWCSRDGRNVTIDGDKIRTPGGTVMTGEYERHSFRYVVPKNETNVGMVIVMVQVNDEIINVIEGKDTTLHVWNCCKLTIS
jgi:hypothetical protein